MPPYRLQAQGNFKLSHGCPGGKTGGTSHFVNHGLHFILLKILRTDDFNVWISGLRDKVGQKQVLARLARLSMGHWGDCKPVGGEVTELRIDSGPGYRVYCWKDGATVVIAPGGGDKSSQNTDIARAQGMVQLLKE